MCFCLVLIASYFPVILDNVHSDLLHKYQSKDDILILTVRLAVIVAVILTVPVLFFTVSKGPRCHLRKAEVSSLRLLSGATWQSKPAAGNSPASLCLQQGKTPRLFLLLQAALFLGLGVLFSLVSIPLVIYDWACSSSSDEGR